MDKVETTDNAQLQGARGTNQSGLRDHNERLILSLLRSRGALAKADIARMTGLSAQTVSNIMRQLEQDGLIVKGEPQRGRVGQPSVPIGLAADGAYFWGVKIGRRSSEVVLIDFLGRVIGRSRRTYHYPTPKKTIDFVAGAIDELTRLLPPGAGARIAGLGIAMPFQIWRWAREIDVAPEKMAAWKTFDVTAALSAICTCPVFLQNDASAACGAELVFGDGPRSSDFIYFYIGYFIGGGIVLNGTTYTGPTGNAGAIGPLPIPGPDGRVTQLLEVASLSLLERDLRACGLDAEAIWRDPEVWDVPAHLLDRWVATTAAGLAHAIPAVLSVIDFDEILIDGWMPAGVRARLVEKTNEFLGRTDMTGLNTPALLEGTVGADARALGAASLPLSRRFLLETRLTH